MIFRHSIFSFESMICQDVTKKHNDLSNNDSITKNWYMHSDMPNRWFADSKSMLSRIFLIKSTFCRHNTQNQWFVEVLLKINDWWNLIQIDDFVKLIELSKMFVDISLKIDEWYEFHSKSMVGSNSNQSNSMIHRHFTRFLWFVDICRLAHQNRWFVIISHKINDL